MVFLAPYKTAYPTARRLKEDLESCKIIKTNNSRFNWNRTGLVINWGRSDLPTITNRTIINKPQCITKAADKINFLSLMEDNNIQAPRLLTHEECMHALREGNKILIREPRGFGGKGIDVIRSPDAFNGIPRGKFAVKFYPKRHEYRAHVWRGEVIALTQKKARRGTERSNEQRLIWNHANGWVHCRENVEEPEGIRGLASQSVNLCGLDFGAVDLMLNRDDTLRVLEVNTAPGVDGQVKDAYIEVIREEYNV